MRRPAAVVTATAGQHVRRASPTTLMALRHLRKMSGRLRDPEAADRTCCTCRPCRSATCPGRLPTAWMPTLTWCSVVSADEELHTLRLAKRLRRSVCCGSFETQQPSTRRELLGSRIADCSCTTTLEHQSASQHPRTRLLRPQTHWQASAHGHVRVHLLQAETLLNDAMWVLCASSLLQTVRVAHVLDSWSSIPGATSNPVLDVTQVLHNRASAGACCLIDVFHRAAVLSQCMQAT